jgi:hypothetical protein
VIVVFVAKGLFILRINGNSGALWYIHQKYAIFGNDEYLINSKVIKSYLFPNDVYVIYTSKVNNRYRVGAGNYFHDLEMNKKFSIELTEVDLTQRPFIALHPLSTNVSEKSSNFSGAGLSSTSQYDDFWIHTVPLKSTDGINHKFKIRLVKTVKLLDNNINILTVSETTDQLGLVKGLSTIPSSTSVLVMALNSFTSPNKWFTYAFAV